MTVDHHPDSASLVGYAAGTLDRAASLVVATHLAMCPACRAEVRKAESVGGALLETMTPEPLADSALKALMAKLDTAGDEAITPAKTGGAADAALIDGVRVPNPLRSYIADAAVDGALPWRRLTSGIERVDVKDGDTVIARMLRIEPGRAVPRHGHDGDELTLVLSGGYTDGDAHFGPGDVACCDGDDVHRPVADPGEPCICLIAADAPPQLTGPFGKLLQPFVRF
jgi:putative transcriptional regulator